MKVLYVGYYKEDSDWGRQTVNNILALDKAGVDVVCRSIQLAGRETPQELLRLEDKEIDDITHCIQHVFPEHMVGTDMFEKNIGIFGNNFVNIDNSSWVEKLRLLDEVWVPSHATWLHLPEKVREIAHRVPYAFDTSVFRQKYRDIHVPEIGEDFKFYTICEIGDTVGVEWILAAFHAEFDPSEPVSLIIQAQTKGDGNDELKALQNLSHRVKSLLRIQPSPELYKKDVIISSPDVSYEDLMSLHQYGDCYVSSNTNVTFPLSEVCAAGFGNSPIVSSESSASEYLDNACTSVKSIFQVVQSKGGMWKDANNGKDFWIKPCEMRLRQAMRNAYEARGNKVKNQIESFKQLDNFQLELVGNSMKERLGV